MLTAVNKLVATWDPVIHLFAHLSFRKAPPPGRIFAYKIFGESRCRGGVFYRDLSGDINGIDENMEVGSGPGLDSRGRPESHSRFRFRAGPGPYPSWGAGAWPCTWGRPVRGGATGHGAGDHPERRAFIQAMSSPCRVGSKDSPSHHHSLVAKKPRL